MTLSRVRGFGILSNFAYLHYRSVTNYHPHHSCACALCRVMSHGPECVYREYRDMEHGWVVRGDIRREEVRAAATAATNAMLGFLTTYLK